MIGWSKHGDQDEVSRLREGVLGRKTRWAAVMSKGEAGVTEALSICLLCECILVHPSPRSSLATDLCTSGACPPNGRLHLGDFLQHVGLLVCCLAAFLRALKPSWVIRPRFRLDLAARRRPARKGRQACLTSCFQTSPSASAKHRMLSFRAFFFEKSTST